MARKDSDRVYSNEFGRGSCGLINSRSRFHGVVVPFKRNLPGCLKNVAEAEISRKYRAFLFYRPRLAKNWPLGWGAGGRGMELGIGRIGLAVWGNLVG